MDAPPGSKAAIFDVDSAFRNVPVAPKDHPFITMHIPPFVHFDNVLNFSLHSSPGIFGNIADAMVKILLFHGIDTLIKWVDDFIFFHYPLPSSTLTEFHFSYDESIIWSIGDLLGWPWAPKKFIPFASSFLYIGFLWNIEEKSVSLPPAKKEKYMQ
jgi:hypothetical protein